MSTSEPSKESNGTSPAAQTHVARSSAIMAAGTLTSRILGFIKGILLATALGTLGGLSSVFESANTLPNLLFIMLAGGIFNVVLVPQIIKASGHADKGQDFLSRLLTGGVLVLLTVTVLLTFFAGPLMRLLTSYQDAQLALATQFAIWLLPQIFFYGLYALLGHILNAHDRFSAYMWAPVVNNVIAIIGLIVFLVLWSSNLNNPHTVSNWTDSQTLILAGSTTLGVIIQALILIAPVRRLGLNLRPRFGWRGMGLGNVSRIASWAIGTVVASQVFFLLLNKVASSATTDESSNEFTPGVFVFNRAYDVSILPHSIVVLSLTTVLFNQMTRAVQADDQQGLKEAINRLVRTVSLATVFFAAVFLVLSGQIGMVLSGGDPAGGRALGLAIAILGITSPFFSLNFMFNRVFYAREDARTPFVLQVLLIIFSTVLAVAVFFFPKSILIYSLLVVLAIGNVLSPLISGWVLKGQIGDYGIRSIIRAYVQYFVAALASVLIGSALLFLLGGWSDGFAWRSWWSALLVLAIVTPVMLTVYLLILRVMGIPELKALFQPILSRLRRNKTAAAVSSPQAASQENVAPMAKPYDHPVESKSQQNVFVEEEHVTEGVEIGSILSNRYLVSAIITESADDDTIYKGIDQVLNRPISILVPSPQHISALHESARDVATGNRRAPFHILDIGEDSDHTYVVTSTADPAELLDLLVPGTNIKNPEPAESTEAVKAVTSESSKPEEAPFVEPLFTETMGLEILNVNQSGYVPGPYDYVYEDNTPIDEPLPEPPKTRPKWSKRSRNDVEPIFPPPEEPSASEEPPTAVQQDNVATVAAPLVTEPLYKPPPASPEPVAPISATRQTSPAPADAEPEFDDDSRNAPRAGRWLVIGVLIIGLIIAGIFGVSQLSIFGNNKQAAPPVTNEPSASSSASPTAAPEIAKVTRLVVGGDPTLSNSEDARLGNVFDKNPATVWRSLQFASPNVGGYAKGLALVLELQNPSQVNSIAITQPGASGGGFEVYVTDSPTIGNAQSVGNGSFTGPEITTAASGKGKYVIINFTELPRLQNNTLPQYPYGLRIGEITVK